ncbi:c-type cytochrome [Chondromyces crocatus]|uniref:Cytochrome C peroxidase n=1 Tax=Chondromyces crocatus TaxID=52 RepID=A0A0K1EMZ2_CHOCO|nr:c-type cytochrome [Chondromyces crocatus]AKT42196.1 cytochrome C peroxidase [Chondromyces crocatus]
MPFARSLAVFALASAPLGLWSCTPEGPHRTQEPSPRPLGPPDDEVTLSEPPPPPVSGGTLLMTREGFAFAADPDRDRIWIVRPPGDEEEGSVVATVVLSPGDEPGRAVETPDGRVHVALRGGGAIAIVEPATGEVVERRAVCEGPRGIDVDPALGVVHVACVRGELVSYPLAGGAEVRRLLLDEDLRDVVVDGDRLLVSRFRSAEVLVLDAAGTETARLRPLDGLCTPGVAWRMTALPGGGAALVHQRAQMTPVNDEPGAYAAGQHDCDGGVVATRVAILPPVTTPGDAPPEDALPGGATPGGATPSDGIPEHTAQLVPLLTRPSSPLSLQHQLLVDVAVSPDHKRYALVSAAGGWIGELRRRHVGGDLLSSLQVTVLPDACRVAGSAVPCQPTAAAYDAEGALLVFSREPARVLKRTMAPDDRPTWREVVLGGESRRDTGHDLFHLAPRGTSITCASCHPEGREDGHVWHFGSEGPRRTQSLEGGVLDTAPLHWDGSLPDLEVLAARVLTGRMGGDRLGPRRVDALGRWMDALPALPARVVVDPAAVSRGEALFTDARVGCAGCHAGPQFTNNQSADVGTGAPLQVPRLSRVGARAPYFHDGCAPTLDARFGACGGGDAHGTTSHLSDAERSDLTHYLQSL